MTAISRRARLRSHAPVARQVRKPSAAAASASSTSWRVAMATVVTGSSVAGSMTSARAPSEAGRHWPLM